MMRDSLSYRRVVLRADADSVGLLVAVGSEARLAVCGAAAARLGVFSSRVGEARPRETFFEEYACCSRARRERGIQKKHNSLS